MELVEKRVNYLDDVTKKFFSETDLKFGNFSKKISSNFDNFLKNAKEKFDTFYDKEQ